VSTPNEITEELITKADVYRNDPHSAKIKPEYILLEKFFDNEPVKAESKEIESQTKADDEAVCQDENSCKHLLNEADKLDSESKRIKIGNNKKKDIIKHREKKLCSSVAKCLKCNYAPNCKQSHDVKAWLANKPKDIDTTCYVYRKFGKCPFGLTCRFSGDHIVFKEAEEDEKSFENVVDEVMVKDMSGVCQIYNVLSGDLKTKLWKRKYDFKRSEKLLDLVNKFVNSNKSIKYNSNKGIVERKTAESKETVEATEESKVGLVTDEDLIKLRKSEKKKIDWKNKLYLAPLTTAGNLPFRRICKEFGVDVTCSEMAVPTNLLSGQASEWALLKKHESEDLFGVQLCGSFPDTMTKACQIINEHYAVDFVDINCGCPIDLIFNKGGGCALMTRMDHLQKIVRSLDVILDVPVTVKIRTGIKEDLQIAHEVIPQLKSWGASMITLHGRSRQQRYSKLADWKYIDECAKICDPVPLFGGGDILSYHDYNDHMENTHVSGCMIARGALYKPWIFTEIKEQRDWDISAGERFDILKRYVNYGLEHWGSDTQGVETTRRFLLEWLSFLYRYIPVGLLEVVPQQINLRPPIFFGRNELETLMASSRCTDWIKLSEMLLGPVPENVQFTPKHKANAY